MKITFIFLLAMIGCGEHGRYQAKRDGSVYVCPRGTFTQVDNGRVYCVSMTDVSEDSLFGGGR